MTNALSLVVLASTSCLFAACPDAGDRPLGATCEDNGECQSGLCYLAECIDPSADDDLDTLLNGFEVAAGADPRSTDSDGDGKLDPLEAAFGELTDSDGDGRPNLIESMIDDADGDCLVDELDPDDDTADPDGCGPVTSCDALFLERPDAASGPRTIDPDGAGPLAPIVVECLIGPAEGGATRLDRAFADVLTDVPGARRYLLVAADGRWALSPPTTVVWDFDARMHLAGTWLVDDDGALAAFECPAEPTEDGVGVGCFVDPGLFGSGADVDAERGTLEVCAAAFGGCTAATVYVRGERCPSTDGLVMDGGFDVLAAGGPTCWEVTSFDGGGDGLGANVFIDPDDAPDGAAPSIRADAYHPTEGLPWASVYFDHRDIAFAAGHGYRLDFWARGAEPRQLLFDVGPEGDPHVEVIFVDDTWRPYSIDFTTDATSLGGHLRFFVGTAEGDVSLWLDEVSLHDLGPDACAPSRAEVARGELIADGGFDFGHACWDRIRSTTEHYGAFAPDDDAPVAPPSLRVEQRGDDNGGVPYLSQREIPLTAGHAYELSFWARAASARTFQILLVSDNPLPLAFQNDRGVGTDWRRHALRMWADPAEGDPGTGLLMLDFGSADGATMWIDDVSLVDLGADPCIAVPPELVGDGGFDLGTRCWDPALPGGTSIETVQDDNGSGSAPYLLLRNVSTTAIGDFALRQPIDVAVGSYEVTLRAKGGAAGRVIVVRVATAAGASWLDSRVTLEDAWQTVRLPFSPTAAGPVTLRVDVGGQDTTWVYLDDISVRPTGN